MTKAKEDLLHGWYYFHSGVRGVLGLTEGIYTETSPSHIIKEPSKRQHGTAFASKYKAVFSLPREFLS